MTLDEWVDKNAADLATEIDTHISMTNLDEEEVRFLNRMIFISIRQWTEKMS